MMMDDANRARARELIAPIVEPFRAAVREHCGEGATPDEIREKTEAIIKFVLALNRGKVDEAVLQEVAYLLRETASTHLAPEAKQ